jgi:hypothetical protein
MSSPRPQAQPDLACLWRPRSQGSLANRPRHFEQESPEYLGQPDPKAGNERRREPQPARWMYGSNEVRIR